MSRSIEFSSVLKVPFSPRVTGLTGPSSLLLSVSLRTDSCWKGFLPIGVGFPYLFETAWIGWKRWAWWFDNYIFTLKAISYQGPISSMGSKKRRPSVFFEWANMFVFNAKMSKGDFSVINSYLPFLVNAIEYVENRNFISSWWMLMFQMTCLDLSFSENSIKQACYMTPFLCGTDNLNVFIIRYLRSCSIANRR